MKKPRGKRAENTRKRAVLILEEAHPKDMVGVLPISTPTMSSDRKSKDQFREKWE